MSAVVPVLVKAHLQDLGDVTVTGEKEFVGTKGESRRLEGFALCPSCVAGVELEYMAHIEGTGDTQWVKNGAFIGTKGQGKRLEGFAVRVVGPNAANYDVKYYAHVENVGDTPVATAGEFVGSRGESKRVEGMAVWLEALGVPPAAQTTHKFLCDGVIPPPTPNLTVTGIFQTVGAITVVGPLYCGTKGQGLAMQAFCINHTVPGLLIEYMAHIENIGDTQWYINGQYVGSPGGGKIEGFAIRISGPSSWMYNIAYYGHLQDIGNTPITYNGSFCGTRGQNRRCEGLAVWLVAAVP